ncbi:MAG: hypothetical protein MI919_04990, partial [Holophagales bacterium]|nr:hypothetical protein [Holophagales bacterium]
NGILPGMQKVVRHLEGDESRHMAYGVFLLSRLVAEHGEEVWAAIESRMGELLPVALGVVSELFEAYEELPFGLELDEFTTYAMTQFQRRFQRIEKARQQSLEEVCRTPVEERAGEAAGG